ncbi:MAG: pantoate--beta-alanine ligase [Gemmatimonadetes bacterium]|nr:pantoate--beta-alanine ligase [Gemmatimonadota bacterium]
MAIARTREELSAELDGLARAGASVALVPTMGALHEGHLSLVDRAHTLADAVVVSIFVNPLQFGLGEDLSRYPRELSRDVELAASRGVRLVFAPGDGDMYPEGAPIVRVKPGPMGEGLCGRFRPGHFEGVLTVVAKLFGLVRPQVAVFGRKDLQQAALVRRMERDLDLGVRVDVAPTVREEDGLALSSRNAYLSPDERRHARAFHRGLVRADEAFQGGETGRRALTSLVESEIRDHAGLELQYVELVDPETLVPLETAGRGSALAVAGFSGATRLIDNVLLGADAPDPGVGRPTSVERAR